MNISYLNENDFFQTTDMALIASLYHFGYKIDAIDKRNPSRVIFLVRRDKKLDELVQGFWEHSLKVDPLNYFNSLKEIKTRLYQ
jgi:hypothetical protein